LGHLKEIDFGDLQRQEGLTLAPPRGLLRFSLELEPSRYLLVYVVHLKSNWGDRGANYEKRAKAMEIAAEDLRRFLADREADEWEVLVVGDMNTDPDEERFKEDRTLEPFDSFIDLWQGRPIAERTTLPTKYGDPNLEFPPICFDRVLVSPALRDPPWIAADPVAVSVGVETADVFAKPGTTLDIVSDHFPVYVDLFAAAPGPSAAYSETPSDAIPR
jgi:endonuclease/exonuclease/phosphatase family metal-dependent hydrolase